MGAWGTGVYDNDEAADWAHELEEGGLATIERALRPIPADGYLDGDAGAAAIAAADVVARLKSGGGETSPYAETVAEWVEANRDVPWTGLVEPAIAAIVRATAPANNELYELWAETDSLDEWLGAVSEIRTRLTAPA